MARSSFTNRLIFANTTPGPPADPAAPQCIALGSRAGRSAWASRISGRWPLESRPRAAAQPPRAWTVLAWPWVAPPVALRSSVRRRQRTIQQHGRSDGAVPRRSRLSAYHRLEHFRKCAFPGSRRLNRTSQVSSEAVRPFPVPLQSAMISIARVLTASRLEGFMQQIPPSSVT